MAAQRSFGRPLWHHGSILEAPGLSFDPPSGQTWEPLDHFGVHFRSLGEASGALGLYFSRQRATGWPPLGVGRFGAVF